MIRRKAIDVLFAAMKLTRTTKIPMLYYTKQFWKHGIRNWNSYAAKRQEKRIGSTKRREGPNSNLTIGETCN